MFLSTHPHPTLDTVTLEALKPPKSEKFCSREKAVWEVMSMLVVVKSFGMEGVRGC